MHRRREGPEEEKIRVIEVKVKKFHKASFIREVTYTMWLTNVVMVKKANNQWRMCPNFIDLNKVCPKDAYLLPSIDELVGGALGHRILSF